MEKTGLKHTNLTDKQLIQLALIKNQQAFSMLMNKYKDALISYIMPYVHSVEDAEDISQRTFEKAFMKINTYDNNFAFSTWLYKIAKHEAIDYLRRKKQQMVTITEFENVINNIPDNEDPEGKVIVDQIVSKIISSIMSLPESYKKVAELRFLNDYAYDDIAAALDMPIGTVKTKLNRARKMLSEMITR